MTVDDSLKPLTEIGRPDVGRARRSIDRRKTCRRRPHSSVRRDRAMALTDIYAQPLTPESLQQFKALGPLGADSLAALARIEGLDVTDFNEAEVRANIIDPMVRILGYEKGTDFSVDLERYLKVLDKNLKPDYKFNLWRADFWLIEAKKSHSGEPNFGYKDLSQALEYAAHPQINAALVV